MPGQSIKEVLTHFGQSASKARRNYFDFVQDGIAQGKREDLVGGGLKRSLMGQVETISDIEIFDERAGGTIFQLLVFTFCAILV